MQHILSLRDIGKSRQEGGGFTLQIPALDVKAGALLALVGQSGCGKSTALDLISAVLRPDRGRSFVFCPEGKPVDVLDLWRKEKRDALARLRRQYVGYVLQTGGLLPFLTGRANIALGREGLKAGEVEELAAILDIGHLLDKKPGIMSVGERQRFAIARALAGSPALVLADEPVASLDPLNARVVMSLFTRLAKERNITVVMVSHAPSMAQEMGFTLVSCSVRREGEKVLSTLDPTGGAA